MAKENNPSNSDESHMIPSNYSEEVMALITNSKKQLELREKELEIEEKAIEKEYDKIDIVLKVRNDDLKDSRAHRYKMNLTYIISGLVVLFRDLSCFLVFLD